jgi:hypothetical protein
MDRKTHKPACHKRLYTSRVSPFASVVEAFLRYERVEYERVEVEPWKKKEMQGVGTAIMPALVLTQDDSSVEVVVKGCAPLRPLTQLTADV